MRKPCLTTDNGPLRLRADVYLDEKIVHNLLDHGSLNSYDSDSQFSTSGLVSFVKEQTPDLWELAHSIRRLLQQGVGAVVIENLPFVQLDLQKSKYALLALASCIGEPIGADPYRPSLVWPVSPRFEPSPIYTPTITEHNGGAEIHTDSAFKIVPENYVLLYAHHPATDGGLSLLLSADRVLAKLAESDSGRECIRILKSQDFPFRVPTVFTKHRSDAAVEFISATILSERPQIRYRYDSIVSALRFLRTPLPSKAIWALAYFRHTLQHLSPGVLALNCGDLLVVNNYLVMHGRTAFEDRERMLLRIRLANTHPLHFTEAVTWQYNATT